jgi:hypothetical protein
MERPPIDRIRELRDDPAIHEEHQRRFAEKQAKLEQTDDPSEGELQPEPPAGRPGTTTELPEDHQQRP